MSVQKQAALTRPEAERPAIHVGYGIHTDAEHLLDWEWVSERMERARNYWIGTVRPDGRPHVIPVWGVWLDETLYFGTNRHSVKARNLAAAPQLALHLESGDEVVIIEGTVEETRDPATYTRIAKASAVKYPGYTPGPEPGEEELWYAVRPRIVLAWLESDYPRTATRWRFPQ